jgi:two-component system, LytTR family, response regulator LytT
MLILGICDDVQTEILDIKKLISLYNLNKGIEINILAFESGEALEDYCTFGNPVVDIIFLDIYMHGKNGIETAEFLRNHHWDSKIIFITSSTEHALESFKVYPFYYLTKPVSSEIFNSVFEKALKTLDTDKQKVFTIKTGSVVQTYLFKDILYFESLERTINLYLSQGGEFSFYSKLDDIEDQLKDKRFIRCHKSFYVNMDFILSVENYSFQLTNKVLLPITQKNFPKVKKIFYEYLLKKADLETNLKRVK